MNNLLHWKVTSCEVTNRLILCVEDQFKASKLNTQEIYQNVVVPLHIYLTIWKKFLSLLRVDILGLDGQRFCVWAYATYLFPFRAGKAEQDWVIMWMIVEDLSRSGSLCSTKLFKERKEGVISQRVILPRLLILRPKKNGLFAQTRKWKRGSVGRSIFFFLRRKDTLRRKHDRISLLYICKHISLI